MQILQSLLQNTGAAQRLPANWSTDGDSQERSRVFQLQALLAALQVNSAVSVAVSVKDGLSLQDKPVEICSWN